VIPEHWPAWLIGKVAHAAAAIDAIVSLGGRHPMVLRRIGVASAAQRAVTRETDASTGAIIIRGVFTGVSFIGA